jgi:nucleoside-diphosphate-sugar epimerase
MKKGLIGYSGFVGSNCDINSYDALINSKNIKNYFNHDFDLLVVAAGDARKWYANQNPKKDIIHINELFNDLKKIKAKQIIYCSTVDVYDGVISNEYNFEVKNHAYGINRFWLEQLLISQYKNVSIIRLGGLFGKNLKKNLIFDAINNRTDQIEKYNLNSKFQFFNLQNLESLFKDVLENKISIINAVSEPISTKEILDSIGFDFSKINFSENIVNYNIKTSHKHSGYIATKNEILSDLKIFSNGFR